jgi:hypothetical protein
MDGALAVDSSKRGAPPPACIRLIHPNYDT